MQWLINMNNLNLIDEINALDDVKILSNYSESDKEAAGVASLCYINFKNSTSEEQLQEIKAHNRDLAIDILIGERDASDWDKRLVKDDLMFDVIAPQVTTVNVTRSRYNSVVDIKDDLIKIIERETQGTHKKSNLFNNSDVVLLRNKTFNSEDHSINTNNIMRKVAMCSNFISTQSRKGPANTIVINPNSFLNTIKDLLIQSGSFVDKNGKLRIVTSPLISLDKVVLMRTDDIHSSGLLLSHHPKNNSYYLTLTDVDLNSFMWFYIK